MTTPLYHPFRQSLISPTRVETSPPLEDIQGVLGQIYARRGIKDSLELDRSLGRLPEPFTLKGMAMMCSILETAIRDRQRVLVIGDYDADGATATALALEGLRLLGLGSIDYLVPNRFQYGYGLTPEIVELARSYQPDILLTVDNGISSHEGIDAAKAAGLKVLITDHHLPGETLPKADAIVNPNLPDDPFPSKALAGVGVMFYVLLGLRQQLRKNHFFEEGVTQEPHLGILLDLVALGTVADVVPLDSVNRILVHQGLERIRKGLARPGIRALLQGSKRKEPRIRASDLGFQIGPRLNAAGRLDDMRVGIECLIAKDFDKALPLAQTLEQLNQERKDIEEGMRQDALRHLDPLMALESQRPIICLFDPAFHQGVVGILASRIKDRLHRPVIVFALNDLDPNQLKGSARSVSGIHIRDILAEVATRHPGLIDRFGGHAMAAGLSLQKDHLLRFTEAMEEEVRKRMPGLTLEPQLVTDGTLTPQDLSMALAEHLEAGGPWGQGFSEPLFEGEFRIASCRIVGENHLKLVLRPDDSQQLIDAIAFRVETPEAWQEGAKIKAAYRLEVNEFRSVRTPQLLIEYMTTALN